LSKTFDTYLRFEGRGLSAALQQTFAAAGIGAATTTHAIARCRAPASERLRHPASSFVARRGSGIQN